MHIVLSGLCVTLAWTFVHVQKPTLVAEWIRISQALIPLYLACSSPEVVYFSLLLFWVSPYEFYKTYLVD